MPRIVFSHSGKSVEASDGDWMYDVCDAAKSGIPFACKAGACGTCACEVLEGADALGAPGARELRTLAAKRLDPSAFRLPCLADVHGDVTWGKPVNAREEPSAASASPATGATAAATGEPRTYEVLVEAFRPLNLTVAEVRFYCDDPSFRFRPGQYMVFHVPGAVKPVRRSYSISTPPAEKQHFEICVRAVAGGAGSNYIHQLRPGARVKVEGPHGDFVLQEQSRRDILMVATGTGIAPIKSMLLHLLDTGARRRVRLFFGVRHDSDLFYTDMVRGLSARYPAFEYDVILSSPDPERWAGPRGRVTDLVERLVTPADAARTEAYLCGGQDMLRAVTALLAAKGFPENAVFRENFY